MNPLYLIVPFAPLVGSILAGFFGKQIGRTGAHTVTIAGVHIIKNTPVPAGSALSALDGKIIMQAADTCVVTSDTAASCDVILSALEQAAT